MNELYRRLLPLLGICFVALLGTLYAGCSKGRDREVVVYTSVDQAFSEPVFRDFEKTTGVHVRAVYDTEDHKGTNVLQRLLSEAAHPQADVFWSGDTVDPFVLMQREMVAAYPPAQARAIPSAYRSTDGMWTGMAARAGVLLVNKNKISADSMPRSINDLADGRWKGQAAIGDPLSGTTAMFVAALFSAWGEPKAQAFLDSLKNNSVRVLSSNDEVARQVIRGEVAFGLVDTDDAHEATQEATHVAVVYPDQEGDGTLLMPTACVLLRGAPHADTAHQMIDYLASAEVEQHMADQAAHIPLRTGVNAPAAIRSLSQIRAMQVDYGRVASEMERIKPLLRAWTARP